MIRISFILILFFFATNAGAAFFPKKFRAHYEQEIKKQVSGKIKKSYGTIDYLYPGKVRFEQSKPEKIVWVSNARKTWFYQAPFIEGEPGQLEITNHSDDSITTFFDSLHRRLESNKDYTVERKGSTVELLFTPKSKKKMGIKKATLIFAGKETFRNLSWIKIIRSDNKFVNLHFKGIEINPSFKAKNFVFVPPKNTKLIN